MEGTLTRLNSSSFRPRRRCTVRPVPSKLPRGSKDLLAEYPQRSTFPGSGGYSSGALSESCSPRRSTSDGPCCPRRFGRHSCQSRRTPDLCLHRARCRRPRLGLLDVSRCESRLLDVSLTSGLSDVL